MPDLPSVGGSETLPDYLARVAKEDYILTVQLYNRGLAAVDIIGFYANFGLSGYQFSPFEFEESDMYEGETLPYRLDGMASKIWKLSLVEPIKRRTHSGERIRLKPKINVFQMLNVWSVYRPNVGVAVALGNGNEVHARVGIWKLVKLYGLYLRLRVRRSRSP